jgi:hypothetical protein
VLRAPSARCTGASMSVGGPESVESWESQLAVLVEEESVLRAQGRWLRGPHDLLGVIGRRRRELTHTAALAWLLDPIGAHGLGTAPLAGLLRLIGADVPGEDVLGWCRPVREVTVERTRVDLLIDGPGMRLVVEVKVDAHEGDRQTERLVRHFDEEGARFVFLTRSGAMPVKAGESLDRWCAISWADVLAMLESVRAGRDPSERALSSVDAYLESLRRIV